MNHRAYKAMLVTESADGKFTRQIVQRSIDELPQGDVLIHVKYSSLNYKDALSAIGNRGVTRKYPHTPGVDAAGVVEESSVQDIRPGDEVIVTGYDLGMNTSGGFGEYIRVPADWVVKRPASLSLRDSMIYGTAGFTAALSVYKLTAKVLPDQGEVLVTGAPGGVGSVAVSILVKIGYQVVAVNGKVDARGYLMNLGAKGVLSVEEATDNSGKPLLKTLWSGAIDTVGGPILSTALRSVNYGGTVTCCGNAASPDLALTVYPFILRGVSLLGVDSVNCPRDLRLKVWDRLANEWKLDHLDKISTEIALHQLDERIELILQGKQTGRTVVSIS
ncbi:MAG: YhdH/YhfP family quinone oxidoreductase [Desulfomonile tiedjei]|uniref:YhdH/YhfP family quinone oxidoreductase n=1 Tax=Desulfomonile tiedjei TaxID=2358 RepID=A0A9D6V583_9BACT|nr:YhdH/YhfP family quinone oxidoreductase [Desulfomonile tiedjei]